MSTKSSLPIFAVSTSMILLAAWVCFSPATYAAPTVLQVTAPSPTPGSQAPSLAGRLRFENNDKAPTGSFDLQIDSLDPPPADTHYELWLSGGISEPLDLGALPPMSGTIRFTGTTEQPLLASYDTALVSIEPDEDTDPDISAEVVLSGTLPPDLLAPLRQLFVGSELHAKGFLSGAVEQAGTVVAHGTFLEQALDDDDLATAKRHAEHVINIAVGEHSLFFNDWDRSGQPPENPGDGFGVLAYLEGIVEQTNILSTTLNAEPDAAEFLPLLEQMIASANTSHELSNHATEIALKIFSTDTHEEAQPLADEVADSITRSQQEIDAAYRAGLEVAELRLFAVQTGSTQTPTPEPAQTVTQTAAAPTATPTKSAADATAEVSPEVTGTAVISAADSEIVLTGTLTGTGWLSAKDGGVYEYVPGGEFTMGADAADAVSEQEQPAHAVSVDGFWLQRTEVTNAQYGRCVADGACTPPQADGWDAPELADHPVSHVDWQQANDYARWAGGRLPTEAEWERACRGDDTRLYPWGNEPPTAETANFGNNTGDTLPVGSLPAGASPFGILDLSGNVWEWTSSLEQPYPYAADDGREDLAGDGKRTARGGSFYYTQYQARCTARSGFPPTTANPNFGLRTALPQDKVTLLNAKDGGVYGYVPGGEFTMGADAADAVSEQEQPAHAVSVDGFWLQRTEVTNAQYGRCVADGACTPPQADGWDAPELADHPVSHVDWQQANDYARWAGGRLPTEAEWERACRGDDTRLYPWGNEPPTAETANFGNNTGDTLPVGSLPAGASPFGILDLSGNVWEWTSSLEQPYPYAADDGREDLAGDGKRTARGGSFYYTQYQARCTARSGFPPTTANPNFGLRTALPQNGQQ